MRRRNMRFNTKAFTINTATGWLIKAGLLVLGVSVLAPPDSLARTGIGWMSQNPAIAIASLIAVVAAVFLAAYSRSRTLRIVVTEHQIEFSVGYLVKRDQLIRRMDIRNVKSQSNLIEQKLGASTLRLETVGTGGVDMELPQLDANDAEQLRREFSPREQHTEAVNQAA